MFNLSKNALKKTTRIVIPTLLLVGLSACSADVARFAYQDLQNSQNAENSIKKSTLGRLSNDIAANPPGTDSQFTASIPTRQAVDSQFTASLPNAVSANKNNENWMYNRNPDSYRVSTGDTLYSISRRYGITVEQLRSANNFNQNTSLNIGQVIFLPRKTASNASTAPKTAYINQRPEINSLPQTPVSFKPAPTVNPVVTSNGSYIVQPKDTLYSIARKHNMNFKDLTRINGFTGSEGLKIGQRVNVNASASVVAQPKPAAIAPKAVAVAPKAVKQVSNRFRWPVSGRVISEYGAKPGGTRNEGINVAVPPGTTVKAAESGTVAYAGNGLPSYGNLVLIKHTGGWVTAYAHNGSLLVKKGDKIKRGQAIARSGQSGDVNKPQLHFEIRRGAISVNPRKYLAAR